MIRIEAVLTPDEAAVVWAALDREARDRAAESFDRADGLIAMSQRTIRGDAPERSPIEVVVTIAKDALAAPRASEPDVPHLGCYSDGTGVSAEISRRLCCDAGVVEMVEDADGTPLSVGRRTRTIPASIKRALLRRDGRCRFPGCTNRVFLDGHHIQHWAHGGATRLDNLCALCDRHHTFVHEHGFRVEMHDGEPVFFDPRGRRVEPEPARPVTNRERAWATLHTAHEALAIVGGGCYTRSL